jgi:hypothetical protein
MSVAMSSALTDLVLQNPLFITSMSPVTAMSPAVTSPGPVAESCSRLGPSPSILSAICLTLRTMSVRPARRAEACPRGSGVLAHAGEAAELVQHVLDLDRGDRRALQEGDGACFS